MMDRQYPDMAILERWKREKKITQALFDKFLLKFKQTGQ